MRRFARVLPLDFFRPFLAGAPRDAPHHTPHNTATHSNSNSTITCVLLDIHPTHNLFRRGRKKRGSCFLFLIQRAEMHTHAPLTHTRVEKQQKEALCGAPLFCVFLVAGARARARAHREEGGGGEKGPPLRIQHTHTFKQPPRERERELILFLRRHPSN